MDAETEEQIKAEMAVCKATVQALFKAKRFDGMPAVQRDLQELRLRLASLNMMGRPRPRSSLNKK